VNEPLNVFVTVSRENSESSLSLHSCITAHFISAKKKMPFKSWLFSFSN